MSEELKPCPFCGSEANLHESDEFWYVACNTCINQTTHFYNGRDVVIQRWNARNDRTVIDGFLARVREREEVVVSVDNSSRFEQASVEVYAEMFPKEQSPSG